MSSSSLRIDPSRSEVTFAVKKLGILTVNGSLSGFSGKLSFSPEDLSLVEFIVCVSPSTITTGNTRRDEHLRSKDFFHVSEYPTICFQSEYVLPENSGYKVTGFLSMLGVRRQITFPFNFTDNTFNGTVAINRMDYGLGKKFPGFIIGKSIQISIKCVIQ